VLLLVTAGLLAGCGGGGGDGRADLAPDTARFSYGERAVTVALDECGRDGDVVLLAGARDGTVVQVAADLAEGGTERTGVTGDLGADDGIWGAFGPDAPAGPGPAGEITGVDVDGDVLTVEGRWARLDGDLRPDPAQPPVAGRLQARCPEVGPDDVA
jgi:hypothetical protein